MWHILLVNNLSIAIKKNMLLIVRALYGLKSSSDSWRHHFIPAEKRDVVWNDTKTYAGG